MNTLGIDPGTATCGWCLLSGATILHYGTVDISGKQPWPIKRRAAEQAFASILAEHRPEVVAIEKTQVPRPQENDSPARVFSMGVLTQHTEELAAALTGLAVAHGAQVVRVSPAGGLSALSCKRGAKDRDVAEAFTRLFGVKLLVRDHHVARAAGVALRGQTEARLRRVRTLRLEVPA